MGNNNQIRAKAKGSIKIEHGKFKYVLYVPSLAANFIIYIPDASHCPSKMSDILSWLNGDHIYLY